MLESMRRVFERIDELNNSFRGMSPRRVKREKSNFDAALAEARKTETAKPEPIKMLAANPPVRTVTTQQDPESYLPIIEKYAKQYGIDPDLVKQVIAVESAYDERSISDKGAMGLMQLMPQTAKELGVTNPFDPEENIEGGIRYLAEMLKRNGGDLKLALAAYNAGPGAVRQFGGVPPYPETQAFIRKVMSNLPSNDEETE